MKIELIVPYRRRPKHLEVFLQWVRCEISSNSPYQLKFHLIEQAASPEADGKLLKNSREKYTLITCDETFHKTRLLNIGLAESDSDLIIPYDVDLIPFRSSFKQHCIASMQSPNLLLSGYRLMSPSSMWSHTAGVLVPNLEIAPEDSPSALRKQLCHGERHGVLPIFNIHRLREISGWNDNYIGWGAEDQDIIERYCMKGVTFARSPNFVYVHLPHSPAANWNEEYLVNANRRLYRDNRNAC